MLRSKFLKPLAIALVIVVVVFGVYAYFQNAAKAAGITVLSDQMTTHRVSVAAGHNIAFRVSSTGALDEGDYIKIDFDYNDLFAFGGFSGLNNPDYIEVATSTDYSTWDAAFGMDTSGDCSPASDTIDWCTSSDYIWLKLGANIVVHDSDYIRILIGSYATGGPNTDDIITNPSSSGNVTMDIRTYDEGSITMIDEGKIGLYITNDQVTITGTVDPSLTFEITSDGMVDTTTCALGTLVSSGVSTCTYYVGVGTNALTGFVVNVEDVSYDNTLAGEGFTANLHTSRINDVLDGSVTAGAEEYGFTMNAPTDPVATVTAGYIYPTTVKVPASATLVISESTGPYNYTSDTTTTDCTMVRHLASVTTMTEAGYYTQTVRYTVTGNF